MIQCSFKSTFGIDCLFCGFQRSFISLINGDFQGSWGYYPPLIPILFMLTFLILHLKYQFSFGSKTIVGLFIISVGFVLINYGVKLNSGDVFYH